jgi:hypothetical protein
LIHLNNRILCSDRLSLADFIYRNLYEFGCGLGLLHLAPLTELFVNRHYGFNSFSPEDANAQVGPAGERYMGKGCGCRAFSAKHMGDIIMLPTTNDRQPLQAALDKLDRMDRTRGTSAKSDSAACGRAPGVLSGNGTLTISKSNQGSRRS